MTHNPGPTRRGFFVPQRNLERRRAIPLYERPDAIPQVAYRVNLIPRWGAILIIPIGEIFNHYLL